MPPSKDGPSKNAFSYQPLDLARSSIRVLRLQPRNSDGRLRCDLRETTIQKAKYRALSYMWNPKTGCSEDAGKNSSRTIEIKGMRHTIGENLWQFLKVAETRYARKPLWIDALCIDQSNPDERNHQVRQMSQIYSRATEVLIWLGPGDEDTDMFFDFLLGPLATFLDQSKTGNRISLCASKVTAEWMRMPVQHRRRLSWGALKFFRNEYWSRLWILQEIFLANEKKFLCGEKEVPYETLPVVRYFFDVFETIPEDQLSGANVHTIWVQIGADLIRDLWEFERGYVDSTFGPGVGRGQPLHFLIERYSKKTCSNTLDSVYGILGLAYGVEDFSIDYRRSPAELAMYTIQFCNHGEMDSMIRTMQHLLDAMGLRLSEVTDIFKDERLHTVQWMDREKHLRLCRSRPSPTVIRQEIGPDLSSRPVPILVCLCNACASDPIWTETVPAEDDRIIKLIPHPDGGSYLKLLCRRFESGKDGSDVKYGYIACVQPRWQEGGQKQLVLHRPPAELHEIFQTIGLRSKKHNIASGSGRIPWELTLSWAAALAFKDWCGKARLEQAHPVDTLSLESSFVAIPYSPGQDKGPEEDTGIKLRARRRDH